MKKHVSVLDSVVLLFLTILFTGWLAISANAFTVIDPFSGYTTLSKGCAYQLNTAGGAYSYSSSNPKIASVDNAGVLQAKKCGAFILTRQAANPATPPAAVTVSVVKNRYVGPGISSYNVSNYHYDNLYVELLKATVKGNRLILTCAVLNNKNVRVHSFKSITFKLYNESGVILKKKIRNRSINLRPYRKKKMTFSIPLSKKKKKMIDLGSGSLGMTCSYYYRYVK